MKEAQRPGLLPEDAGCDAIEQRIHQLLDSRQSLLADPQISAHIARCECCAETVSDYETLEDSFFHVPLNHSGPALEPDCCHGFKEKYQPIAFVVSVACVLLVMLGSIRISSQQPSVADSNPPMAGASLVAMEPSSDASSTVSFPEINQPERLSLDPSILIQPSLNLDQLASSIQPLQQSYLGSCLQLSADLPGIRPVSHSVHATYQLLRGSFEYDKPAAKTGDSDNPDLGKMISSVTGIRV